MRYLITAALAFMLALPIAADDFDNLGDEDLPRALTRTRVGKASIGKTRDVNTAEGIKGQGTPNVVERAAEVTGVTESRAIGGKFCQEGILAAEGTKALLEKIR